MKSAAKIVTLSLAAAGIVTLALAAPVAAMAAESDAASGASSGAASDTSSTAELQWARDALARNGALEVVSTDRDGGTITVRVKATGEVRKVRADEVIAYPSPDVRSRPSRVAARESTVPSSHGHVIASGPGYSIAAANPAGAAAGTRTAGAAGESESTTDAGAASDLPVEHRHEPFICQGSRLVQIDNRNLVFDGDAVSVEKGCELHITNSSITAHGVGVAARGASVHIDNSIIQGSAGAVDASDGAQVYARSSVFKGLIRRNDTAAFHDLGGNVGN